MIPSNNPEPRQNVEQRSPHFLKFQEELGERIEQLADRYTIDVIGSVDFKDSRLPLYRVTSKTSDTNKDLPKILLTAGVHGNEKGGIEGAMNFLEDTTHEFTDLFQITCYPCINPRGYLLNSRWNGDTAEGKTDLNRSFIDGNSAPEVIIVQNSLKRYSKGEFLCSIDLHETLPNDAEIMAEQYPDRDTNEWEATPTAFYMYEVCDDRSLRVGSEVVQSLESSTPVCKWSNIFGDKNTDGVIFYPEGANNTDYLQGTSLDSYLYGRYTNHAFTTETYGDISVEQRGAIQSRVVRLILSNLLK